MQVRGKGFYQNIHLMRLPDAIASISSQAVPVILRFASTSVNAHSYPDTRLFKEGAHGLAAGLACLTGESL